MTGEKRHYGEAVSRLSAAQKSGQGVPAYLRWVNRGIGRRMGAMAYVLGLSPNAVTLLSAAVSFTGIGIIALAAPNAVMSWLAVVLLLTGYALDSADGQLARLLGVSSPAGEWLDHVVDALRLPAFHLGVAIGLYRRADAEIWTAALAVAFALVASTWFIGQLLAEKLGPKSVRAPGSDASAWVSLAKQPYDVSTSFLTMLFFPWLGTFIVLYAALLVFTALVAVLSLYRKYRWLASVTAGSSQEIS
ncbi:CDP-alcohol phosphatidyltransferase family protein [Glutamicibacter sp. AOP33-2CA-4]|uniref:CDP-alcohol phosphatidyltransferase family protein n=1 Tax=Glutamicibacter sp. AOP33-2CA-4 TaxID=3457690 RepID=UPI0040337B94